LRCCDDYILCARRKAIRRDVGSRAHGITKIFIDESRAVSGLRAIREARTRELAVLMTIEVTFVLAQVCALASFFS
jgi:hypothetical protein